MLYSFLRKLLNCITGVEMLSSMILCCTCHSTPAADFLKQWGLQVFPCWSVTAETQMHTDFVWAAHLIWISSGSSYCPKWFLSKTHFKNLSSIKCFKITSPKLFRATLQSAQHLSHRTSWLIARSHWGYISISWRDAKEREEGWRSCLINLSDWNQAVQANLTRRKQYALHGFLYVIDACSATCIGLVGYLNRKLP